MHIISHINFITNHTQCQLICQKCLFDMCLARAITDRPYKKTAPIAVERNLLERKIKWHSARRTAVGKTRAITDRPYKKPLP